MKKNDTDLLRTPVHGIPLGELIEKDGIPYLHVIDKKHHKEDDISINQISEAMYSSKRKKKSSLEGPKIKS
jgi:hypothetical protein